MKSASYKAVTKPSRDNHAVELEEDKEEDKEKVAFPDFLNESKLSKANKIMCLKVISDFDNLDDKKRILLIQFLEYRQEIKANYKSSSSIKSLIKKFLNHTKEDLEYLIELTISSGWRGLIWDKANQKNKLNSSVKPGQFHYSNG